MSIDTEPRGPGWIWDVEPGPWATFNDALLIDKWDRHTDGLRAVRDWADGDLALRLEARNALEVEDWEWQEWERDINARRAAYHKANPGDRWDRRAA